jgi:hypothetical protein
MKKATERMKKTRHSEPSEASLKEIPEVDFTKARVRRNPYAARIAKEGITVQVGKGRPKKLEEVGGTSPRSVRFPDEVWRVLEARAKQRGLTLHAALRAAILAWIGTDRRKTRSRDRLKRGALSTLERAEAGS